MTSPMETAREALEKMWHRDDCTMSLDHPDQCSCGFLPARAALNALSPSVSDTVNAGLGSVGTSPSPTGGTGGDAVWRLITEEPDIGRKFIALYNDGSGAVMLWRHDEGMIDSEGDDGPFSLKGFDRWAYLPDELEFWCETNGEDPVTLRVAPEARATSPSPLSAEGVRDAGEASGQPTEPNPPISPLPTPGGRWTEEDVRDVAELIVRDVAELPDRTSPDDWPEAMLVTGEELHALIVEHFADPTPPDKAVLGVKGEREGVVRIANDMTLVLSQAWDEEQDRDWGAATDELKLDRLDELLGNLIALLSERPAAEGWRPTHRHVKRGSDYQVIGEGFLCKSEAFEDEARATIYRDQDDTIWVRATSEFNDGRFQPLPACPALPQDVEGGDL